MLTKYLTGVSTSFSPFNARSGKTARLFLALLPPNARSTMAVDVQMLPKSMSRQPGFLNLKFSKSRSRSRDRRAVCADSWGFQRTAKKCNWIWTS